MLRKLGIGSPAPVGYYSTGSWLLFGRSYFVCLKSDCPYTYRDFEKTVFPNQEQILRAIARTTAMLHENGLLHKDYSAGNILFEQLMKSRSGDHRFKPYAFWKCGYRSGM